MKRIISGLLSLCIAAGVFSVYGYADIETVSALEIEAGSWIDDDGNKCLTASDGGMDFYIYSDHAEVRVSVYGEETNVVNIVIPEECNGVKVTVLQSVYSTNGSLFSDGSPIILSLPKTLTTINESELSNIAKITVDKDNPVFCDDNGVLYNKDKTKLIYYPSEMQDKQYIVPDSVQEIAPAAFMKSKYTEEFIVDSDNDYFSVKDGVLYDKNQTKLIHYPGGKTDAEYTVPDTVLEISDYGFSYNSCLTTVKIPESVKNIGEGAFYEARALESISIPESVTELRTGIFTRCSSLTDVSLPDSLIRIDDAAFGLCVRLESINIPDSVEYIGIS
ncbi:MAG: leucine-rich repeat domain-containing protein, partial [Oscillospiraceae bacterium]|nr:leucine-rich repeat domain-containing protein [Oscillospiraceae bacterium]